MGKSIKKSVNENSKEDKKFYSVFENSINGIIFGKPDGSILEANSAAIKMFGYSLDELKKVGRHGLFDLNDPNMVSSLRAREKEGKSKGVLTGIRKNGEQFPCEFSSVIFKNEHDENRTSTILTDISERKKTEEEIALLLNNTEESFVLIDKNLKIVSFNKSFKDGYKLHLNKDAMKGDCILDYGIQERRTQMQDIYTRVLGGESVKMEIEIPNKNKGDIILSKQIKPALDQNGNVIGIFITSRDITKKRQAEQLVINNEKRFHAIIEHTSDIVSLTDEEGRIIYISPSLEKITGLTNEEVKNKSYELLVHPDDRTDAKLIFEELLQKPGGALPRIIRIIDKNGNYIWIEGIITNLLQNEHVKAIVSNCRDITDKILTSQQKEFERKNTEALINNTTDLIWSVNTDFDLIAGNKAFLETIKRATGTNLKQGDNLLLRNYYSDDIISFWEKMYKRTLLGESFKIKSYSIIQKNTAPIYLEISFNPIHNGNKIIGLACYARNITKIKNTLLQLEKNEQKLRQSHEQLTKLTENVDTIVYQFEISPDGKMTFPFMSKSITKIIPYINIELLKEDASEAFSTVHPDDLPALLVSIEESRKNLTDWKFEYRSTAIKNNIMWIKGASRPNKKEDGTIVWYGYLLDITDSVLTKKALYDSEERYRTMVECSPDPIAVHANGKILYVNPTAIKLFGANSLDEMVGKSILDVIHPDCHQLIIQRIKNTLNGIANDVHDDCKLVMLDGTIKDVESEGTAIVYNGKPAIHIVLKDITEQKQEKLRLKLLESVITNTTDSVIITEPNAKTGKQIIIYVNDSFLNMTGYLKEDIIGKTPRMFRGSNTDQKELGKIRNAIANGKECQAELVNCKKNGEEFWVSMAISPITNESGKPTHFMAIERDITDRKLREIEREQIIAELSQNNKDLKQFSYVTSHNLRAPIANLLGLTTLIDQYKIPNKSLKQIIDGIRQSALIFDDTVKDLTKVLIIKDQVNIVKEKVSFITVVNKVMSQLSITVDDNDVKVDYNFKEAPFVNFTNAYLESVLLNLFTNSIKYKSPKRKLKINISSSTSANYIILKFDDNGIGIDTELHKEKLFKLYQRFHNNPDGKGLGLYLVKSQIEALGGTVEIESKIDVGTTFIIKFKK